MADSSQDNFIRCHAALHALLSQTLPSLQNAIDVWHTKSTQTLMPCSTPNQCPQNKKPSTKNHFCQSCIDWANAIEGEVYPPSAVNTLQWRNANPILFSKDPLEVVKLFVLRIPANQTFSRLGDFDVASLLMIMSKFKEFHRGDQMVFDKIEKVSRIRNVLSHMKLDNNLRLDEQTFGDFWTDITNLVDSLQSVGRPYFNQQTAQELHHKLAEIRGQSIPLNIQREALRPIVEDLVLMTLEDVQKQSDKNAEEDPERRTQPSTGLRQSTRLMENTTDGGFVKKVAEHLKEHYMDNLCKKQLYPWKPGGFVDLNKIFVPVTIDIDVPGPRPIKERLKSYLEIFSENQPSKRFVLMGRPGQGKSTYCAKLSSDWCKGDDLKHIELLFILQLGLVNKRSSIEDAICSQLKLNDLDPVRLGRVIRELGQSVVIVFDSLDEADSDLFEDSDDIGNLVKIIKRDDMRDCRVLVTTRPWRTDIIQIPVFKRLDLQNFTKSEMKNYVKKFFSQNKEDYMTIRLGKDLVQYIEENRLLVDASTPLMLLLICWYWMSTNGRQIPDRIGLLYDSVFQIMYESLPHAVTRKEVILDQLGRVAVEGLTTTKTKIIFTEEEMMKSCTKQLLQLACAMGIINYRKLEGEKALQFFHKSGQEFCSGTFLKNYLEELSSYLKGVETLRDALSIGPVLVFAAGSKPAAKIILIKLLGLFTRQIEPQISDYYAQQLSLDDTRSIQQFIELCLECNFEANAESELTEIMRDIFTDGQVLFHGISSKTASSFAYFMKYCDREAVRHITIQPIAHASDPFIVYGPINSMHGTTLHSMKSLSSEEIEQINRKFRAANPDLHEVWEDYTPAHLAAYIPCIQACADQPSTSDTNITPIIRNFEHIKLETLDVDNCRLAENFDGILDCLQNGQMQSMSELRAESNGLSGQQITRLAKFLHRMPLLRILDISDNKAEAGQNGIPVLAANLKDCHALQELDVSDMDASEEDMEILTESLPSQLGGLSIHTNGMNDRVAMNVFDKLPAQRLTHLDISVCDLSEAIHNTLLSAIRNIQHTTLRLLSVRHSPYGVDLVRHARLVLTTCNHLEWLVLHSTCKDLIPKDCMQEFIEAIQQTTNLKILFLYGIILDKEELIRLVECCREKGVQELWLDREDLPEGIDGEKLDDFVTLV